VLPHPRCFRTSCRAIVPLGFRTCPVCGSRITSNDPLVNYTIYLEDFTKEK
jgi:hypothetical protein